MLLLTIRVSHFFLVFSHSREVLHYGFGQVLQSLQFHFDGLQLRGFTELRVSKDKRKKRFL